MLRLELKRETSGATSMIVAQRIGTILDADQIIVLEDGRIVGKGTHRELLSSCEVYREIAMSQLSEEELAV
jgi:ATP-binding cassette subfamily B protein